MKFVQRNLKDKNVTLIVRTVIESSDVVNSLSHSKYSFIICILGVQFRNLGCEGLRARASYFSRKCALPKADGAYGSLISMC